MLLQSFHPVVGGAERQALQLSRVLMERGARVEVLTRRLPGLPRRERVGDVPVTRLAGSGTAGFALAAFTHLVAHARDISIVHVHLASSHAIAAALAGRLTGTPVVVKIGGAAGLGEIGAAPGTPAGRCKLRALRWLRPRLVTVNADQERELDASGLGSLPRDMIPNGVDVKTHRPAKPGESTELRRELGRGGLVVLVAGRLADDKGQLAALGAFLDAWARFVARHATAILLIAGDGPQAARWRESVASRGLGESVRFLGRRDDLPELYRASDGFVLISRAEGMSNAILEAMASGLPILAPRVSGVVGLVEEGTHGALFDPLSVDEAFAALRWLAESPDDAAAAGRRGRAAAEARSLEATADAWLDLYARAARDAA